MVVVVNFVQYGLFLIIIQSINCQRTHEHYRTALFARPETIQKAEALYKVASQNVSTPMDKAVENILKWLQLRYQQKTRIARQETLANMRSPNYTMRPQPFSVTKSPSELPTGYPIYNTYPTPQFYPYNQTSYTSPSPSTVFQYTPSIANTPFQYLSSMQNTQFQFPSSIPTLVSNTPFQYPTLVPNNQFYPTSSEPAYTYILPDSQNPDIGETTDTNNFISQSDIGFSEYTTTPVLATKSVPPDENAINQLESESHQLPHIHAIDVQCSKDRMTINIEFNEVYNGLIYSKGFYNDPNCHYVRKNSGQTKYSFVVQLNSCGTQFIDEFYKGKQAFLENVLVLQNEPGIQEVWDTVRSVRCLWEGSIKQTLSAGLNVETLNQDILTFSGDMISARLEIQLGRGPNAPAANGLVKIGDDMTLAVTVDGDAAFDILVRNCMATDGNPNSGNIIQLTDEQGCITKPKLFGNFQTMKSPDPNRPSVVAYAYFKAFKFPDVMDLLIECNVELCKSQCQSCNQQTSEPIRQKRLVNTVNVNSANATKFLSEKLHVISSDDIKLVSAMALRDLYHENENQICFSETTFYLQNIITAMFFLTSCIVIILFWIKLKKLTEKTQIFY